MPGTPSIRSPSSCGLLALVATPAVGVLVAIVSFAAAGDRDYAVIATIVMAALLLGFFLSGGTG